MLEERLKYLYFFYIENSTKLLLCEEAIIDCAIKNVVGEVLQRYVICLLINCLSFFSILYLVIVTLKI